MQMPSRDRDESPVFSGLSLLLPYVRVAGLVGLCLLIILSVIPGQMQVRTPAPKAFEHLTAYFIVASTLALGFGSRRLLFATAVAIFLIAFSGALELAQEMIPGRTGRLLDWEASSVGAILGTAFAVMLGNLLFAKRHRTRGT
jgi:VanZ family protein